MPNYAFQPILRSTFISRLLGTTFCAVAVAGASMFVQARADEKIPVRPTLPKILALSVQPSVLTLEDSRDARTLIVTGKTAAGYSVDLSSLATIKAENGLVRIDKEGYVLPVKAGQTRLRVSVAGLQTSVPVNVKSVASPPISFVRDVEPILSKAGCNAGTCHGSAKGKNGFKLSLRGYDPDYDHHALIDDIEGRRFNRTDPPQSLMLLKPISAVPHKGGQAILPGSNYYNVLKQWIGEGVVSDTATVKRVASLEVLPAVPNLTLPGMTQKTLVIAHYPDGTTRDVTREAVLTSSLPETAIVKPNGEITAVRRGEAALLVRYEGTYATTPLTVLGDRRGYQWADAPVQNYIDTLVDQKLKKIKAVPAGLCDDATFLRRVSIDLAGIPPHSGAGTGLHRGYRPLTPETREGGRCSSGLSRLHGQMDQQMGGSAGLQQQIPGRHRGAQVPYLDSHRYRGEHALRPFRSRSGDGIR